MKKLKEKRKGKQRNDNYSDIWLLQLVILIQPSLANTYILNV